MKSPMNQRPDDLAHTATEDFIATYARKPGTEPKGGKAARKKQAAAVPDGGDAN
jgi:hypothetical protein